MAKSKPLSFGYLRTALSDLTNEPYFTGTAVGIFSYTKRHTTSNALHLPPTKDSNPAENLASSRRSVSQGAVQKTAREKIKNKKCAASCTVLTET